MTATKGAAVQKVVPARNSGSRCLTCRTNDCVHTRVAAGYTGPIEEARYAPR